MTCDFGIPAFIAVLVFFVMVVIGERIKKNDDERKGKS